MFDITSIKIRPLVIQLQKRGVEYEYHSDLSSSDRSRITMDHLIWPDWSSGRVHVTGAILLVTMGKSWHDQDVFGTCT